MADSQQTGFWKWFCSITKFRYSCMFESPHTTTDSLDSGKVSSSDCWIRNPQSLEPYLWSMEDNCINICLHKVIIWSLLSITCGVGSTVHLARLLDMKLFLRDESDECSTTSHIHQDPSEQCQWSKISKGTDAHDFHWSIRRLEDPQTAPTKTEPYRNCLKKNCLEIV